MIRAVRVLFLAACLAAAQTQPPPKPQAVPPEVAALVKQQFGATFTLQANFPTPLITADFDGDGVEDVAIVAVSNEPFPDSFAFKYRVVDPYMAYFGLGNPAISSSYSTIDPARNHDLLIIFGSGPEAWRAAAPKAKFVMINLPFDDIAVGRMLIKKDKPPVYVIKARESQLMDSAVWWDVKKRKWHWEPGNTKE
jgi:protein-disulfide isomerase